MPRRSDLDDPGIEYTPWLIALMLATVVGSEIVIIAKERWEWLTVPAMVLILSVVYFRRWLRWRKRVESPTSEDA